MPSLIPDSYYTFMDITWGVVYKVRSELLTTRQDSHVGKTLTLHWRGTDMTRGRWKERDCGFQSKAYSLTLSTELLVPEWIVLD